MATINQIPDAAGSSPRCPVSFALNMFGDRWSLLLIRDMMLFDKQRYGEFLTSGEGISTNILADRLKQMQHLGLVEKFPDPHNGKASLYLLTDRGLSLFPILLEVIRWGLQHDDHCVVSSQVAQALTGDSASLANDIIERITARRQALQH